MRIFAATVTFLCLVLMGTLLTPQAKADEFNKKTIFTFSGPFEVPGYKRPMVLPAGTYVFKLLDTMGDRDIVQIFNKDETHLYTTILAIPDYRMQPTSAPIIRFEERAAGSPQAVKAWFYPGDLYGQEFVYPRARAVQLAKATNQPVLSMPEETAQNMTEPNKTSSAALVKALENAPVKGEEPNGNEVEMSQVVNSNPPSNAANSSNSSNTEAMNTAPKQLPKTASEMPLLGLAGLLLCGAGIGLRLLPRKTA